MQQVSDPNANNCLFKHYEHKNVIYKWKHIGSNAILYKYLRCMDSKSYLSTSGNDVRINSQPITVDFDRTK